MANHTRHKGLSVFRSSITEADGQAVNVWYLGIFWAIVVLFPVVSIMAIAACFQMYFDNAHVFPFQDLGTGIGLVIAAFGAALTAIATAMRNQADKQP